MMDKIWATFLAILIGNGMVEYLFNHEEKPWSWIGPTIYFLFFLATLYQIKHQKSLLVAVWDHYRRKVWLRKDGDI